MAEERVKKNLILDNGIMQDMLEIAAISAKAADEVDEFVEKLSKNPFSPDVLKDSVEEKEDFFYKQLPSGVYVFWEILRPETPLPMKQVEGAEVRPVGASFDRSPRRGR